MLLLILADRDIVRLVEQDIRRHERWIGEEAAVDVIGVLRALVLELGHAAQFAEHRIAVEDPAELRVLVNMALDEQGVLLRVKAAGDVLRKLRDRAAAQLCGVLTHGKAVQVGHEIIAVKLVSELRPVLDRAEVVAEVQVTGGLDAREHSFLFSGVVIHNNLPFCRPYLSRRGGSVSGTAGGGSEKAQYERLYIVSK